MKYIKFLPIILFISIIFSCDITDSYIKVINKGDVIDATKGIMESNYTVTINITANESTYVNARVYDQNGNNVLNSIIKVDGVLLEQRDYGGYFSSIPVIWEEGSSHSFSVSTPDGGSSYGIVRKPVGLLTGVTYNPPKPTLALEYTVTPPTGGWPKESYVYCRIRNNNKLYGYPNYPQDMQTIMLASTRLTDATDVSFISSLINKTSIKYYNSSSVVKVTGNETSW